MMKTFRTIIASAAFGTLLVPSTLLASPLDSLTLTGPAYDVELAERLEGRILLQVEEHGEAYFVHTDGMRYYMKNGASAYEMMRTFGLGITDSDLDWMPAADGVDALNTAASVCAQSSLAQELRGRILLQVEQHGEAWYVDPDTCLRIYMEDGDAAYEIMRERGLGITNSDLEKIQEADAPESPFGDFSECLDYEYEETEITLMIRCELEDLGTMVVEANKITQQAEISFTIRVPEEEMLTENPDGRIVTMLPVVTNIFCELMNYSLESMIHQLSYYSPTGEPNGLEDAVYFRFVGTFEDIDTGEDLSQCSFREYGYDEISFTDYQELTADETLLGVLYGDGESSIDFFSLLLEEALKDVGEDLTEEEQAELEAFLTEDFIDDILPNLADSFGF